ncbi:arginase family protein [Deinococcus sp.]|uniref:arginase family protein n=1 Tax=Deinococcus sp. TaxID=47478 RepID=UPI003CC6BC2E
MNISIVAVPYQMDVARWNYALGPAAFLDAGLVARLEALGHRVQGPVCITLPRSEYTRDTVTNLGRIAARTSQAVSEALTQPDSFVIVLEGDCTHAVGAVGGLSCAVPAPGVVWLDAHGDLHTYATTGTGYVGGMPYAVMLGWDLADWREAARLTTPIRPEVAALIGASDLDPEEIQALEQHRLPRLDADALQEDVGAKVQALLKPLHSQAVGWYLHIDVDVAGPDTVPGGMTPTPHPPSRAARLEAVRMTTRTLPVRVMSLATYNPSGDVDRLGAHFGLDMVEQALAR